MPFTSSFAVLFLLCSFGLSKWSTPEVVIKHTGSILDICFDYKHDTILLYQSTQHKELSIMTLKNSKEISATKQVLADSRLSQKDRNKLYCRQNPINDIMVLTYRAETDRSVFLECSRDSPFRAKYTKAGTKGSALIYINATGRTAVFTITANTLSVVTRPKSSEVFSKETEIYKNHGLSFEDLTSTYTKKKTDYVWHIALRSKRALIYFQGTKNGAKWDSPYLIKNIEAEANSNYRLLLVAKAELSSSIFLFFKSSNASGISGIWSTDHGDDWSTPATEFMTSPAYYSPYAQFCGTSVQPILIVHDWRGNYVTSVKWTSKSIELEKNKAPFDANPILDCQQGNKEKLLLGYGDNAERKMMYAYEEE